MAKKSDFYIGSFLLVLFLAMLFPQKANSQNSTSKIDSFFTDTPFIIQGNYNPGKVFPTNDFVKGQNFSNDTIDEYNSFSLLFLKQTTGNKLWEQLYKYPVYGIGVYTASFKETTELGNPISVYTYFSAPFIRGSKLTFNYEIGLGLTFNWNNFDPLNNPNNIAISEEQSVYIQAGLYLQYQLFKRFSVGAGYGLYHFSNGHLKSPNQGLNMQALELNLRYHINQVPYEFIRKPVPEYNKHNEWDISIYGGAQNVIYSGDDIDIITKYQGMNFPVFGVNNTFSRAISYKSKIGAGISIGYNGALNAQLAVDNGELDEVDLPFGNHITMSIYPSYELMIDRLAIVLQPGFYVYRKKTADLTPAFYQRIGVKYHFWKDYFLGINLRAYKFHISDFIEWNIGRRIKW